MPVGAAVRYQGYYWAYAANPPHGSGDFMAEVAPLSNLIFVMPHHINGEVDGSPLAAVRRARSLGMQVIVDRPGDLFVWDGSRWALAPDWPLRWAAYREAYQLDAIVQEGIFAIYFMDEPDGNGVTKAEQETAIQLIHETYPGVKVTATYRGSDWLAQNGIPAGLDILSFDHYGVRDQRSYTTDYLPQLERIKQLTGIPILLTVESFDLLTTPTPEQQSWYVNTAAADPQVIGLLYFAYTDRLREVDGAVEFWRGARAYPDVVDYHRAVFQRVRGGGLTSTGLSGGTSAPAPAAGGATPSSPTVSVRSGQPAAPSTSTRQPPVPYYPGPVYLPPSWVWTGSGWKLEPGHWR